MLILVLVFVANVALCQNPQFYDFDPSTQPTADPGIQSQLNANAANNLILHELLKEQLAILIYQDPNKARFLELNPANLAVPYDFDSDFYIYTGLEKQGSDIPSGSGGKLKLLEVPSRSGGKLRLLEVPSGKLSLLEKLPHLQDLPAIIQKYINLLESEECVDFPLDWIDDTGKDCAWYVNLEQCEQPFVPVLANNGYDAKQACCGCGGGEIAVVTENDDCTNIEDWTDLVESTCGDYEETPGRCEFADTFAISGMPSASEACCVCRPPDTPPGTSPPGPCTDLPGFKDPLELGCAIYERFNLCSDGAAHNPNGDGVTAAEACCVCKEDPPPPVQFCSNPQISDSNAHIECGEVQYGDLCSFECDEDYELIGQHPIFCDDGVWRNLPECREKTCPPPEIDHSNAFTFCSSVRHGLWCFFECEPFYELVPSASGQTFPQCAEGQWSEFSSCEAQALCSSPPILHASVEDLDECGDTPSGRFCIFNCNEGFTLDGIFPVCGTDGLWAELPSCVPDRVCPIPPIDHSDVGTECASVPEAHFCIFSCEDGYKKQGEDLEVYCQEDEPSGNLKWSGFPLCVPEVICPQPNIPNAETTCSDIPAGGTCDVVCSDGFQIDGEDPVCLEDGTWNELPSCTGVDPCEPLEIENSNSAVVCPSASHGENCLFECDDGFGISRADGVKCRNSRWEPPLPFCDAHSKCNFPPVENSDSSTTCHMTPHGDVCHFKCDDGYEQTGVDLTCNDGKWEPNNGTDCIRSRYCTPPIFENSNSFEVCAEAEGDGYCFFQCNDGYKRDGQYPQCRVNSNGLLQWSYADGINPPPTCEEIPRCIASNLIDTIPNSSPEYISGNCADFEAGEICVPTCKDGYEQTGTRAVCEEGGSWDSNIECEKILKCDPPQYEHSDSFLACNYTLVSKYCAFTCEEGYQRIGQFPRCIKSSTTLEPDWNYFEAEWTGERPGCNLILQCSQPIIDNADENSVVKCHNANETAVCMFDCRDGYKIEGTFPVCQSDGTWASLPECVKIDTCPALIIANSDAECNTKKVFEECEFQCEQGWERNGSFPTCLSATDNSSYVRPQWSGTVECIRDTTCKIPPNIAFSDASKCYNMKTDLMCDYICNDGFTAIGSVTCIDGDWYYEDVSGYFSDPSLATTRGAQCVVITPENKINFLNRQLFRGDGKSVEFFSGYEAAVNQLERKFDFGEESARIANEIARLLIELEALEAECKAKYDQGIFTGDGSWEDLCDRLYLRDALYIQRIIDYEREAEALRNDDINELKDRLDDYVTHNKYIALVPDGVGRYAKRANWIATPSAKEMYDNLRRTRTNSSVYYEVTLNGNYSEFYSQNSHSEGQSELGDLGRVNHIASYSNTSEFQTISYTESSTHMIIDMQFRSWGKVQVRPDLWYDDTWTFKAKVAENQGRMKPGYTYSCDEPDCGDDVPLTGPRGVVYSRIHELFVASDVSIYIEATGTVAQQIETIMHSASSIRVGPFCSGAACHTTGNVIIGGDDLTDHGSSSGGVNKLGWLYIEQALKSLAENTFRGSSQLGKIAVLGSSEPPASTTNGAGAAIRSAAAAAGLEIWWYEGAPKIQQFFDELQSEVRDPQIIWIPGTGSTNDLDAAESAVLALNAMAINNFADSGGGLLAHGEESADGVGFDWIQELLPDIQVVFQCDYSSATLTPAGYEKFSQLSNTDIRSGPCHAHFTGNWGNLEALALDTQGRAFIIGGYGGIIEVSSEETTSEPASVTDEDFTARNHYEYKNEIPQILLSAVTVV